MGKEEKHQEGPPCYRSRGRQPWLSCSRGWRACWSPTSPTSPTSPRARADFQHREPHSSLNQTRNPQRPLFILTDSCSDHPPPRREGELLQRPATPISSELHQLLLSPSPHSTTFPPPSISSLLHSRHSLPLTLRRCSSPPITPEVDSHSRIAIAAYQPAVNLQTHVSRSPIFFFPSPAARPSIPETSERLDPVPRPRLRGRPLIDICSSHGSARDSRSSSSGSSFIIEF